MGKVFKSLQAAFLQTFPKKPPEFPLCEGKFCPRQEVKAFGLKAKYTDRANISVNLTHITTYKIRMDTIIR